MKTARFWIYHNGWVKLSLRDGEVLEHYDKELDEEGYSSQYNCWQRDGDIITNEIHNDSRCCDGRFSSSQEIECDITQLKTRPARIERHWDSSLRSYEWIIGDNPNTPQWQDAGCSQRDYAAEAMGY